MDSRQTQLAPRKKSFWKMLRTTVFLPARSVVRLMSGCGGGKSRKLKRRLTIRNMQQAKDAFFLQSTIQRPPSNDIGTMQHFNEINEIETRNLSSSSIPTPPENIGEEEIGSLPSSSTLPLNPLQSTQQNAPIVRDPEQLPAPLNLDEAQLLLESLALTSACNADQNQTRNETGNSSGEQVVNVEIEPHAFEPTSESFGNLSSSVSSSNWDQDEANNDYANVNDNVFEEIPTRPPIMSSTLRLDSIDNNNENNENEDNNNETTTELSMRRSRTSASLSYASQTKNAKLHGWKSSIEISSNPPVTLAYIPSGLLIGDRIVWVRDDLPEIGTVRWIGKIRNQFYAGIEFDKPIGNSSGIYGYGVGMYKRLFTCQLPYGRFVPVGELVLYKDYHDTGVRSGIVCVICRDDFLDNWEPDANLQTISNYNEDDLQPPNMVSTKCGHLYHWGCLDHWFSTKKKSEYHCPLCLRTMARDEVIRIFPSQI